MATYLTPRASQAARSQPAIESKGLFSPIFRTIGEVVGQLFRTNASAPQRSSNTKDSFGPITYQKKLQISTQALIQGKRWQIGQLVDLDPHTLPFLDQLIRGQGVR